MKWLFDMIDRIAGEKFTGSITINFYLGGITNVTKTESFKPSK